MERVETCCVEKAPIKADTYAERAKYLLTDAEVSLGTTEITCLQWLPLKAVQQNISLKAMLQISCA